MEKSVYIVKPDAWTFRYAIEGMVLDQGLLTLTTLQVTLSEHTLGRLYPDLFGAQNDLWRETLRHFAEGSSWIVQVIGEDAINVLRRLCGEDTNPNLCAASTIRRLFGESKPTVLADGSSYWRNAVHRPKNKYEAKSDLLLVDRMFGSLLH